MLYAPGNHELQSTKKCTTRTIIAIIFYGGILICPSSLKLVYTKSRVRREEGPPVVPVVQKPLHCVRTTCNGDPLAPPTPASPKNCTFKYRMEPFSMWQMAIIL